MQFVVERNAFMKELARVTGVVATKGTIPILANVRIEAGAGGVMLRGTDLEMEAEAACAAAVTAQGATSVGGKLLESFVKRCPDGSQISVTLDGAGAQLKLVCERTRSAIPVLPVNDFPSLDGPKGIGARSFSISASEFKAALGQVAFAIGHGDGVPGMLQGLYMHDGGERIRAVATDKHQLAIASLVKPAQADGMPGVILPYRFVIELLRVMSDDGEASLSVSNDRVSVTLGEFRLISNLLAGPYPDYPRVIPPLADSRAFFSREAMIQAIQRVSIVIGDKDAMSVRITLASGEIRVATSSAARGACFDAIDADVAGEVVTGVNYRYLLSVLGALGCDRVCIHFGGPESPLRFAPADDPETDDCMIVMPMRVAKINEEREAA
jgi:DNA polymerase-3 subunit beta